MKSLNMFPSMLYVVSVIAKHDIICTEKFSLLIKLSSAELIAIVPVYVCLFVHVCVSASH